jgi:hypothetical protein
LTYSEIRDRIDALIQLGGWSNAVPGPDLGFLANHGLQEFTTESRHNIETLTLTTIANQAVYSLLSLTPNDAREWLSFNDDALLVQGAPLNTAWIQQTTREIVRQGNRLWRVTASGTPAYWYWFQYPKSIALYCPPATAGQVITFEGLRNESPLMNDGDVPELPEVYHEGICLFGAWFYGKLYARGDERVVAQGYRAEAMDYVNRMKNSMGLVEAKLIQRRVMRPQQEYLGAGTRQVPVYLPS